MMRFWFYILVWMTQVHCQTTHTPKRPPNEMLLPIHSTTALMCDPMFSNGQNSSATWYKDGKAIAKVTSQSNANYLNRPTRTDEPVPEVGFLLISDIQLGDEGLYWCRRDETNEAGEVFALKVAYVDALPSFGLLQFQPIHPRIGAPFMVYCPAPQAHPAPSVSWFLNSRPITQSASESTILSNGSLLIKRFSLSDFGMYECTYSNFAGRTTTRDYVDSRFTTLNTMEEVPYSRPPFYSCSYLLRNGLLWFLVGCLLTSGCVLLYLLCAVFCLSPRGGRNRLTISPALFLRSQLNMAPGFRKAVVPLPDLIYTPATQTV